MDQSWKMHYKYFGELNIVYTLNTFLNASVLDPRDLQGSAVLTKMKSVETTLTWSVADTVLNDGNSADTTDSFTKGSQKTWVLVSKSMNPAISVICTTAPLTEAHYAILEL